MAGTIKADVVITYPNEEGEWSTLKLTTFEANYVRKALDLAMSNGHGTDYIEQSWDRRNAEDPKAYAS
jgi:hypothetical protein